MFTWIRSLGREIRGRLTHPEKVDIFRLPVVVRSRAGIRIDEDTALRFSAVWAAVSYISQTIAGLGWRVYRRRASGGKEELPNEPASRLLHRSPNPEITPFVFREVLLAHALTWGNGYAEIERDRMGRPLALWPISPDRVTVERDDQGIAYIITQQDGQDAVLRPHQMFHLRGLGFDGLVGYSVIQMAAQTVGLGLGTERFGAAWFGNGSRPAGVFTTPNPLSDKARARLREAIEITHRGPDNAGGTMLLENGMTWVPIGIPPEDAQFLETRKFQVSEISRWYNIPPHKLRDLERATFSNITEQQIEAVQDCILPWTIRLEQEANMKLLSARSPSAYTKMKLSGLLRGDTKTRFEAYKTGLLNGWMSPDEIRELEDMNPLPGGQGKIYLVPGNEVPLDRAGEQMVSDQPALPAGNDVADGESEQPARDFRPLLLDCAQRLVKIEIDRVKREAGKRHTPEAFRDRLAAIYDDLANRAGAIFAAPLATAQPGRAEMQAETVRGLLALHAARSLERGTAAYKTGQIDEWISDLRANRPDRWATELLTALTVGGL